MASLTRSVFMRKYNPGRWFHTSQIRLLDPKTVEEVKIPVPWGHIAGKWWGSKQSQPIIAIHGFLDNASSYDTLLPLLNVESVFCLDLPGHGQTSHWPKGASVHYLDYIFYLRYIINHYYKWNKISLLSHSFGSTVCYAYAGLYPDQVKKMVNMECSRFWTATNIEKTVAEYRSSAEGFILDFGSDIGAPSFSWEESVTRLFKARIKRGLPLSRKSCEIIAKRGITQVGDSKYRFSHDKKLKYSSFSRFTKKLINELAMRITCEALNINASDGLVKLMPDPNEWHENLQKLRIGSKFTSLTVKGGHHVHLEAPEIVSLF